MTGVNQKICEKIGLINTSVLLPKADTLNKLVTFIPKEQAEAVTNSLHEAGAGQIGKYKNCSFQLDGQGTFMPGEGSNPRIGETNKQEYVGETRVEVIFPAHLKTLLIQTLREHHPYEEVAYYISPITK